MSKFKAASVDTMIARSCKAEGTVREYQHQTALAVADHVLAHDDYNKVATFLTKMAHVMPSKAEQLSVWFGLYFPMSITCKDMQYSCKAEKKRGEVYEYHRQVESWRFAEAKDKPYWHKVVKQAAPKEAGDYEALRDLLAKFGSDKAYNKGTVTARAAKLANKWADQCSALLAAEARKAADDADTIKAQAAHLDAQAEEIAALKAQLAAQQDEPVKAVA